MPIRFNPREQLALAWSLLKWGVLGAWVGVLSGTASAFFLVALGWATQYREGHPALLWGLPFAGMVIAVVYGRYGESVVGGNNLLLERIHDSAGTVPLRMAPLILISTVVTHLFGGSAGREGTAVQMGGSLGAWATRPFRLSAHDRRLVLMSGISGGFGSVFGTPLAGTVFGMEVLSVGRVRYDALIPCFVAAIVGDVVCRAWGVGHLHYPVGTVPAMKPLLFALIVVAGGLFGGASLLFAELTDAVSRLMRQHIRHAWVRPAVGGAAIIALTLLLGTREYLGLGIPLIQRSFGVEGAAPWAFALKIAFTAITLGAGFKGGEVTPLFCIGATLGSAFAKLTGQPTGFFAALGFVAVFAGAANTPLACILMGIELFGAELGVPLATACIVAYILSGHRGIYLSQQVDTPKAHAITLRRGTVLRAAREGEMEVATTRLHSLLAREAGQPQKDDAPPDHPA